MFFCPLFSDCKQSNKKWTPLPPFYLTVLV
jgi:hypothetical protein